MEPVLIDIHSHILPGLDDGPEEFETSVAMARMAAEYGTTDIVATPHSDQRFPYDPEVVAQCVAELQSAVGDEIRIHRGCDFHLFYENIVEATREPAKFCINGSRYLLVEFAEIVPQNIGDILERFLELGVVPVITHPERNRALRSDPARLKGWVSRGCAVQITGQSFLGRFGKSAHRAAGDLAKAGLAHFVASDAHDLMHRPPRLDEAYREIASRYGEGVAETLIVVNPHAALSGGPLTSIPRSKRFGWF
jgi:protein-tyrosine phosphatase